MRLVTYEPTRGLRVLEPARPHDIFVSYAREELDFVHQLRAGLTAAGFEVWIDVKGIYGGEKFWPELEKGHRRRGRARLRHQPAERRLAALPA